MITRPITSPLTRPITRPLTQPGTGGGGDPGEALFAEAIVHIDPANKNAAGNYIANPNFSGAPSSNLLSYITDDLRSQSATNITITRNFADGPTRAGKAARVQHAATNAYNYKYINRNPPAGQYTVRHKLRSAPGAGTQALRSGWVSDFRNFSIDETGWTTITYTFTCNGSNYGDYRITNNAGPGTLDYLEDEYQFYPGDGTNMPAFADEVFDGAYRRHPAYAGSITLTSGLIDIASSGGIVTLQDFLAGKNLTEMTLLVACDATALGTGTVFACDKNVELSTVSSTMGLLMPAGDSYSTFPVTAVETIAPVRPVGDGLQIAGIRLKAAERDMLFHEIPVNSDTTAFAGFTAKCFRMGSASTLQIQDATTSLFTGKIGGAYLWARALTDAEIITACAAIRASAAANGATMGTFTKFWTAEGDSITATGATGTNAPGYFYQNTDPAVAGNWGRNSAVAGNTLAQINSRRVEVARRVRMGAANGRVSVLTILTGTNDAAAIVADAATWYASFVAYLTYMKANIGTGKLVVCTLLPKNFPGYNAQRNIINGWIAADSHLYDALCDFGAEPHVGPDGAPAALVYYDDTTHPNTLGHSYMGPLMASTLAGLGY